MDARKSRRRVVVVGNLKAHVSGSNPWLGNLSFAGVGVRRAGHPVIQPPGAGWLTIWQDWQIQCNTHLACFRLRLRAQKGSALISHPSNCCYGGELRADSARIALLMRAEESKSGRQGRLLVLFPIDFVSRTSSRAWQLWASAAPASTALLRRSSLGPADPPLAARGHRRGPPCMHPASSTYTRR